MEYYQARFPGYEDEVAAEYAAICHVSPTELQGSVDMMAPEARYLGDLRIGNYLVERERRVGSSSSSSSRPRAGPGHDQPSEANARYAPRGAEADEDDQML